MTQFAILVQHQQAACFQCDAADTWTRIPIRGELIVDLGASTDCLRPLLKQMSDMLNEAAQLNGIRIHVLYSEHDVAVTTQLADTLAWLQCDTHTAEPLEPWLVLAQKAAKKPPKKPLLDTHNDTWLAQTLLPIINRPPQAEPEQVPASDLANDSASMQALQAALSASQSEVTQLKTQLAVLQAQLAQIRASVPSSHVPELEQLLVYLPAFYRNFWGKVRPDELALLAGTLNVPTIASPYTDPSPDTVLALKRRFLQLPDVAQAQVLGFCQALPHKLDVRSEVRDLLVNG